MQQSGLQMHSEVSTYYGEHLNSSADLRTSACCDPDSVSERLKPLLARIDDEILTKFYGCGSPIPYDLAGCTVLDLGCGTGRDCYLLSQLVGPDGSVIGVDMTPEQLAVARRHLERQMDIFEYEKPNVSFQLGFMEDLGAINIADNSIDVVVSNCVINLSPDKESVFREIFRVLRPGGELYFSDVFADRRVPLELADDRVLIGECLAGAMYIEDFRRLLSALGYKDFRNVSESGIELLDDEIIAKAGMIDFRSMTVRAFKCDFEDICENYGHVVRYLGTMTECPHVFNLDDHHAFHAGLPVPVCGNTARMLSETRYARHFQVDGDFSTHFGSFDCAGGEPTGQAPANQENCC